MLLRRPLYWERQTVDLVEHSTNRRFWLPILTLICAAVLGHHSGTSAAPPAATNPKPEAPAKDVIVERPSLPYLTLLLARDPAVHAELALDRARIDKIGKAIASVDQALWQLRDVPVDKSDAQTSALLVQLRDQLKRDLKKSQLERLDQLILQSRGTKALISHEVAQRIKLSTSQITQLKKVITEAAGSSDLSEKDAKQPARSQEARNQAEIKRVNEILNAKQTAALTTLVGKPFDFSQVQQIWAVAPEVRGVDAWINSDPLTLQQLRGKVVVVHFWAFGCINCIRNLPHYQSWHEKFSAKDVTIIGFQTPETDSERNLENLRKQVRERQIAYPVAFDLQSENWKVWANNMWPSVYLIDKRGQVRNWWYGELNWQGGNGEEFMRKRIEQLVAEPD